MGKLPPLLQEKFETNPRFVGYKFPDVSKPESIDKKYAGKMGSKALNLMTGMLHMEEDKRLTAIECLAHPFFDGMRSHDIETLVQGHL